MTGESRVTMHTGAAALIGLALLLTGASASYLLMRSPADSGEQMDTMPTNAASGTPAEGGPTPATSTAS
jgi:hypothetical protein